MAVPAAFGAVLLHLTRLRVRLKALRWTGGDQHKGEPEGGGKLLHKIGCKISV